MQKALDNAKLKLVDLEDLEGKLDELNVKAIRLETKVDELKVKVERLKRSTLSSSRS